MNALSLKSDTKSYWDFEAVATRYDYLDDIQRNPTGVGTGATFKTTGYNARLDGTGWSTQDIKGILRPTGYTGNHELSFGLHHDLYSLNNPTYMLITGCRRLKAAMAPFSRTVKAIPKPMASGRRMHGNLLLTGN